ncbi:MAG: aminotransferase class IV [Pedosphaera sp.]|nr:aminotransferase class IV [Pedosphaera sp.]
MGSVYIQANTDGKLHSAEKPSISPLNRGFLYGDAIYEVWRTYDGILFAWDEHWHRLQRSAQALGFLLAFTQADLLNQIKRTVSAFRRKSGATADLYIRLQVTRGAGVIGLNTVLADKLSYVLLIQTLKPPALEQVARGIKLGVAKSLHRNHPSTLNPSWKTGNYLNNILCLREALAAGAEEVVMTNLAGEITESAVANIAFVRDGALHTPPLSVGILEGITRAVLVGPVARAAGVAVHETAIRPEDLASFTECFLTGTTREIHSVSSIDDTRFTVGPDTVTAKLQRAFADYTRAYISKHRRLRVLPRAPKPLSPS